MTTESSKGKYLLASGVVNVIRTKCPITIDRSICYSDKNPYALMKNPLAEPQWLLTARSKWPKDLVAEGLDARWSPYWIKKFLGYLEVRNQGRVPYIRTGYVTVESVLHFIF